MSAAGPAAGGTAVVSEHRLRSRPAGRRWADAAWREPSKFAGFDNS
jgi:hypothetical protein